MVRTERLEEMRLVAIFVHLAADADTDTGYNDAAQQRAAVTEALLSRRRCLRRRRHCGALETHRTGARASLIDG